MRIRTIPFIIIVFTCLYSGGLFILGHYGIGWKHILAFILVAANAVLYFYDFKKALLATGLLLLSGLFNLISFFAMISSIQFGASVFGPMVASPPLQLFSLVYLVIYLGFNGNYLLDLWLDYKASKVEMKK